MEGTAGAGAQAKEPQPDRSSGGVGWLPFLGLLLALVVILLLGGIGYQMAYADRIFPGMRALGADLGGHTLDQAAAVVASQFAEYSSRPLQLRYGERYWSITPAELGVVVDPTEAAEAVYRQGRETALAQRLQMQWQALSAGHNLVLVPALSESRERQLIDKLADELDQPPTDARLEVSPEGKVVLLAGREGLRLNQGESARRLHEVLAGLRTGEVVLAVDPVSPRVVESDLEDARQQAEKMLAAPLVLRGAGRSWTLIPAEIGSLISFTAGADGRWALQVDRDKLRQRLVAIAAEVEQAPENDRLEFDGSRPVVRPGREGRTLDVEVSLAQALASLPGADREVALAVLAIPRPIGAEDLVEARRNAEQMVASPLLLRYQKRSWTLSGAQLAEMIEFVELKAEGRTRVEARLSEEKMRAYLAEVADEVKQPGQNARFNWSDGKLTAIREGQPGLGLDVAATVAAIRTQVVTDRRTVDLPVTATPPAVTASDGDKIVIRERIGEASTTYVGAIAAKVHNIGLAASLLNGVVLSPGQMYSFNREIGPTTLQAGFQSGYGIVMKEGNATTVPSVGGGICQVATTLFQAVYWAGYQIDERNWHLYWIDRYGQPPAGRKGLDATVDADYGVDLRFTNNTPNFLLVRAVAQNSTLTFSLYGIKPGWEVEVEGPAISNVVPADPTPVEDVDPSFPPGRRLWVEQAESGFTATFVRRVKQGDQVDNLKLVSRYVPARNVVLVSPADKKEEEKEEEQVDPLDAEKKAGEQPASSPDEQKKTDDQPASLPDAEKKAGEQPASSPDEQKKTDDQPASLPDAEKKAGEQPVSSPDEQKKTDDQPVGPPDPDQEAGEE